LRFVQRFAVRWVEQSVCSRRKLKCPTKVTWAVSQEFTLRRKQRNDDTHENEQNPPR